MNTTINHLTKIKPMTTELPEPKPITHTRVFLEEEIIAALKLYLKSGGVDVPEGRSHLWGLEQHRYDKCQLTLVIYEPGKK